MELRPEIRVIEGAFLCFYISTFSQRKRKWTPWNKFGTEFKVVKKSILKRFLTVSADFSETWFCQDFICEVWKQVLRVYSFQICQFFYFLVKNIMDFIFFFFQFWLIFYKKANFKIPKSKGGIEIVIPRYRQNFLLKYVSRNFYEWPANNFKKQQTNCVCEMFTHNIVEILAPIKLKWQKLVLKEQNFDFRNTVNDDNPQTRNTHPYLQTFSVFFINTETATNTKPNLAQIDEIWKSSASIWLSSNQSILLIYFLLQFCNPKLPGTFAKHFRKAEIWDFNKKVLSF